MLKDTYEVKWLLEDESGLAWWEKMYGMTLSDFEVAYGNITDRIIRVEMRLER